jgi:EmrB/QacA subfamily drug resistance transporter
MIAVLMPEIIADLDMSLLQAEWANAGYTLTFAALLLPAGWLGDRFGRRRILIVGIGIFLVGTLGVGAATSGTLLIAARVVQGVGGALISPSTLSVINATFRGRDRTVAFAAWGAAMGGGAAIGPLLGGWIAETWDWRAAFLVCVPVAALAVLGAWRFLDESSSDVRGLDIGGVLLSVPAISLIVFALIEGQGYGWIRPRGEVEFLGFTWPADAPISPTPIALLLGLALAAMFVRHELATAHAGRAPLADLRLFRYPSFRYGNITVLIVMLGEFGVIFTLPLFCQVVLGFGTLTTGWVFASLSLGALVAGGTVPRLARRFEVRTLIIGGMILEGGAAMTLALTLSPSMGFWSLAPVLFFYGLGIGTASAQLTGAILGDVPPAESGQGSAIQSTSRQLGSVLGTAVLGSILAATISSQVSQALADVPDLPDRTINPLAEAVADSGGTAVIAVRDEAAAGAFAGDPREPFVQPVIDASVAGYTQAVKITLGTGSVIILLGALSATRLPRRREEESEQSPQGATA